MRVLDQGPEICECICASADVPDADPLVVPGCHNIITIVGPEESVDGAGVRSFMSAQTCGSPETIMAGNADGIFHVQDTQAAAAAPDIPEPYAAVRAAAGEYVVVSWAPCDGQHCPAMACQRVCRRAGP